MPGRPPKAWMKRCMDGVAEKGGGYDPGAVCGAVWKRKGPAEKAAIVAAEEKPKRRAKPKAAPKRSKPAKKGAKKGTPKRKKQNKPKETAMSRSVLATYNMLYPKRKRR